MRETKTRILALAGILGAAYAALTLLSSLMGLAYGPVQFRLSEALTVLPWLFPGTAVGLFAGCLVANLLSPFGLVDLLVGSAATLLAGLWTERVRSSWLAPLPPVVCNMIFVGGELAWYQVGFGPGFWSLFVVDALWVGLGEAVVCFLLGGLLLKKLPGIASLAPWIPPERRS